MNKYQAVENVVYKYYKKSVNNIRVKCRRTEYKIPRFVTWYMNRYTQTNNSEQGRHYVKHPSTILNGIKKVYHWCDTDKDFKREIDFIDDLVRDELGLEVKILKAHFGTKKEVIISIYVCPKCFDFIYTKNKEKGYCTNCGANLKFEV